ncbi:MAG: MFS transporter [Ignavibacteriales bacterium]
MEKRRNRSLAPTLLLAMTHSTHDLYLPVLMALMPLLISKLGLTHTQAGGLVAAYNLSKVVGQPVAGFFVDRTGWLGFTILAVPLTGLLMSSIGCWPSYFMVAAAVALGNLSSAVFHPQAIALSSVLGGGRRGLTMGVFNVSGSLGIAFGPVLVLGVVGLYGLDRSYLAAVPALLFFPLLWKYAPWRMRLTVGDSRGRIPGVLRARWRPLLAVWMVCFLRSWAMMAFYSFLTVYLAGVRGWAMGPVKWAFFAYLLGEGAGSLLGGHLSDRWGRKAVVITGLLLAGPLTLAFLNTGGAPFWPLLVLGSMFLSVPLPVLVVMAQEVCPEAVGTASGLMGTAEAAGGLLVAVTGILADTYGLQSALSVSAVSLVAPLLVSLAIPGKARTGGQVNARIG